ncbi:uncharacterized protein ColSpa_00514 [Colletotrichum spaethianum]|uniref:Uncharacterized protein n=1 Tax=Colletotrichum spaethianum TaxID=700344 RepID=A0AA37L1P5_9PEZI|nr:uncharacterized protein ColSpa_00514 [Colletotrichum spaethianum]GKT40333.1 hypothetical protein ColSpa_00514 [Colletotrichum spaethianum]
MPEVPSLPAHLQAASTSPSDAAALEALHRDLHELLWNRRNKYYTWWGDFIAKLRRRQAVLDSHRREQSQTRHTAGTGAGANGRNTRRRVAYPVLDQLLLGEERVLNTVRGIVLRAEALLRMRDRDGCVVDFVLYGLKSLERAMEGVEVFCERDKEYERMRDGETGTCWRYLELLELDKD